MVNLKESTANRDRRFLRHACKTVPQKGLSAGTCFCQNQWKVEIAQGDATNMHGTNRRNRMNLFGTAWWLHFLVYYLNVAQRH
jgi:hypothetical protein